MWKFDLHPDSFAVVDDQSNALTYRELKAEGELLKEVVGKRCLVFHLCQNTLGSLLGYTAFVNHNIVPAMLSADIDEALFRPLYSTYCPKFIWTPQGRDFPDCECVYERFGYRLYKTPFDDKAVLYQDLALLLTTSGSTGSPKFVRQSYVNIRANTNSIVSYLALDESEKPITTLPMNYTYGISILNTHLDVGATILLTDKSIMQREFWDFFREQRATSFGGVPYTYEMLKRIRFLKMDLPSLRTMTQAGGKLLTEIHKEFAQWAITAGKQFIVMYGQCEATARMAYLPNDMNLQKIGSMGIAIPGGSFELVDEEGNVVSASHTTGELIYRGANVTLGYAECIEDLKKGDEFRGILHTGDMAQRDDDGYYFIVGRKKRFLKIFGNRVNLDELERLLRSEFPKVESVCAGVDDKLYIFSTEEAALSHMRRFASGKTGIFSGAFVTKCIPEIPKNESGKTLYKDLEKYYD